MIRRDTENLDNFVHLVHLEREGGWGVTPRCTLDPVRMCKNGSSMTSEKKYFEKIAKCAVD